MELDKEMVAACSICCRAVDPPRDPAGTLSLPPWRRHVQTLFPHMTSSLTARVFSDRPVVLTWRVGGRARATA
jgi:hypothetical protein